MLDTILAPLDGSQLAECVLPHITAIARTFDANITLLRVLERNQADASTPMFDLLNWHIHKTKASIYLESICKLLQESGLRAQTSMLEGLEAEGISEYAQSTGAKLIVLSSHGRNGITQWGISNITQKIIQISQTSILVIRARQNEATLPAESETPQYQRILVPLDGSQRAENVLPVITQLAHYHNSQIHFVQIVQPPEMARQMPPSELDIDLANRVVARNREEAQRYLEQVRSRSSLDRLAIQTHLITSDNAAAALHQLADQEHIELLALSAHGYSGNLQWPYGSMVNNFITYGKVPLLIIQDLPGRQESGPPNLVPGERAER